MGVEVEVKAGYEKVWLYRDGVFDGGDTATVTDDEWAALSTTAQSYVTVTDGSVPDPERAPVDVNAALVEVNAALAELDTEKAPLASPAFSGTPTVPTAAPGINTTQAASTAFVKAEIAADTDGWTYERLAADWTNTTDVLSDIFTGFAPAAGVTYEVECYLTTDTAVSTNALIMGMSGPASPQRFSFRIDHMTAQHTPAASLITGPGILTNNTSTVGNPAPALIRGTCRWTTPGAGNVRPIGRREDTTSGSVVTIYAKSYMRWRALP